MVIERGELKAALKVAIARVERKQGYSGLGDRKVYTLAEFDWGTTYGFGDKGYDGAYRSPAGVYMIEGSPCRGVFVIYPAWDGWHVNFVGAHHRFKFVISFRSIRG